MAALFAIMAAQAMADPLAKISDYRPVFQECQGAGGATLLAIRRLDLDGQATLLLIDPATLATRLERDRDWVCADTDEDHQKGSRYMRSLLASDAPGSTAIITNGGLAHGTAPGSFLTGDLCPSRRKLDRAFIESLMPLAAPLPLALSISGEWLTRHQADFQWLRDQERAGAVSISWVNHSNTHPFVRGAPVAQNFLLTPGVDIAAEILDTEKLLIAHGATPSAFFRFPGLVSSPDLMRAVRDFHLIVLGANSWLARTARARPSGIILVHLNGNEPEGLRIFSTLLADGKIPQPFRPIEDAP